MRVSAASGLHYSLVAQSLGFTTWEILTNVTGEELDQVAEIKAKNTVDRALYEMVASQNSTAATIFWVKSYGYPATNTPPASASKPEKKKPYLWNPNDPNDRVIFTVYNNDGEPNYEY